MRMHLNLKGSGRRQRFSSFPLGLLGHQSCERYTYLAGLYCPSLIATRIWAIPGIPRESILAWEPAKLIKQFWQNFEQHSISAVIVPGITWNEYTQNEMEWDHCLFVTQPCPPPSLTTMQNNQLLGKMSIAPPNIASMM